MYKKQLKQKKIVENFPQNCGKLN